MSWIISHAISAVKSETPQNCSTVCTDAGFGALGAVIGSCDEVVADVACGDCGVPRLTGEPRAV